MPAPFLAFFVGLVDGDGYILVSRTEGGYIKIQLVISLHIDDLATLEYVQETLGIGKINTYPDAESPAAKYIINKTDLQEVLFPLMMYHSIHFLTGNRRAQFNLAMYAFINNTL